MNLSAKKTNLFIVFLTLYHCSTFSISSIDAKFKLQKLRTKYKSSLVNGSEGVRFYQKVLSQTLSSHCELFPNDSLKTQLDFKRCSPLYAIYSAMERFIKEPDAAQVGLPVVQIKNKNYFFDLPYHCKFWN